MNPVIDKLIQVFLFLGSVSVAVLVACLLVYFLCDLFKINPFRLYTTMKIQVTYKSGVKRTFWAYNFTCSRGNGLERIDYDVIGLVPLFFNVDEIESVWQVDYRRGLLLGAKKP